MTCFVSTIPGKFQPIGSSHHADKSGQLPKTEPLRLRYSSLQRLWHWQPVTGGLSENGYYTLQKSLNTEYQEIIGVSQPEPFLMCKGTADWRNAKWRLRFQSEDLTAAFRKFSHTSKIWVFRLHSLTSHLSFSPFGLQSQMHIKRFFSAMKLNELYWREKNRNFKIQMLCK